MRRPSMYLLTLAGTVLAVLLAAPAGSHAEGPDGDSKPTTPIEHVLVLMQENHSFDNYFGTYPGADGIPADTCMPVDPANPSSGCVRPFHIGDNDVQMADPDHSGATHDSQYSDGRMDGFVYALNQRNQDGRLAMGYYDDRDLPSYWNIADEYVLFDRFFTSAARGSFTNHVFWVSASAGHGLDRTTPEGLGDLPTIFDSLQARGISWKFYVENYNPEITYRNVNDFPPNRASQVIWVPLLNYPRYIDDPELASHIVDLDEYFEDLKRGTLPAVAYMVPSGPSEHPPQSPSSGQTFVRTLINELMRSDAWYTSAFMWTYDDWGGWYDHVPPPQVDEHGYGFRVPALLVSPYARRGHVDSTVLDFTSIMRFIEDNWHLEPLTERDANANSIASAFDFTQEPREPRFIGAERGKEEESEPSRAVIYLAYAATLVLPGLIITGAVTGFRLHRRRRTARRADVQVEEIIPWRQMVIRYLKPARKHPRSQEEWTRVQDRLRRLQQLHLDGSPDPDHKREQDGEPQ